MRCAVRSRDLALQWGPMAPQTPPVATPVASVFLPKRTFSRAALGMSLPPGLLCHPPKLQSWLSPMPRPTRYPADAPAIAVLSMLRVPPPFAWKLDLVGRKRARVEFVAATWEVNVETQAWGEDPRPSVFYSPAPSLSGVQWKEVQQLVALFTYRLRGGGHWKLETAVRGRQEVAEG